MASDPKQEKKKAKSPFRALLAFAIIWWLGISFFIVHDLIGLWEQGRTYRFVETIGTIERIERVVHDDDDGATYSVKAAYSYRVGDRIFHGDRVRYAEVSSNDRWAGKFVAAHPADSKIAVFYDPANPFESVLIRGIEGFDLFQLIFMTPFVGVGLFLVAMLRRYKGKREGFIGMSVQEAGRVIRIRPSMWRLSWVMLGSLTGGAFAAIFVVGFLLGGFHPPLAVAVWAWAVIVVLALVLTTWTAVMICSGRWDVLFDGEKRVLRVKRRNEVPYDRIEKVWLKREEKVDSDGDKQSRFGVVAKVRDKPQDELLLKWSGAETEESAQRFAAYAAVLLGVQAEEKELAVEEKSAAVRS